MQANEWLTMGNGRYVRQLDLMLTLDNRPEPVRAVRQPHLQDDPVHKVPAVRHGGVPAVRAVGVPDNQEDMMREPLMKSPSVQMKQVQEVPHVQQDESDEGVPVQEGGGVGTADDPADQGHGVRDGDAHDGGQDRPKKPPDADNGGEGAVKAPDEKEVPDEEPHEEHDNQSRNRLFEDMTEVAAPIQKAMEIAPLDALYPMIRVSPDSKKQEDCPPCTRALTRRT